MNEPLIDTNITKIQPYTNDELWSPEKFALPLRSRLHHLQPMKIGTPMVESLTSYVTRLAHSHGVFVRTLLSNVINPLLQQTFIKDSTSRGLKPFFYRSHALNGYGRIAGDFVEVLNQLTLHKNLFFLTLIPFSKILVAKGLLRPYKAWCPICYQQWKHNQQVVYDPLIWSLTDIKSCLIHHNLLVQNCPHCNHQLLWLDWKSVVGYCQQCSQWLGDDSGILGTTQERWQVETVGELLGNSNQLFSVLTQGHIQQSLCYAINQVTEGNMTAFAQMNKIPKNTFWGWYSGKNLPSLSFLLQISYNLNISLLQFLTQDFTPGVNQWQNLKIETESSKNKRLSPRNLDLSQIEHTLTLILSQDSEPPLTIKEIAEQLQVNRRVLSRHFPELCQKLVAKRRNYLRTCHLSMIDHCCQEIREAIASLHQSGEHPTESLVCEMISNPGYFRYKKVRLLYKQEVQSYLSRL